jgi:3-methyladenine DNA glycosylase/8-oxoguanine DNA glycosylase
MTDVAPRVYAVDPSFSLAQTVGPVVWGIGAWPSVDWIDGKLIWVGDEDGRTVWRRVEHPKRGSLTISGSAEPERDRHWLEAVLGVHRSPPWVAEPPIADLAGRFPGLRPWTAGSLYEALVTSIVGQSISVRSAAATERRLAALFHPGIELDGRIFWPAPTAERLAGAEPALVRTSGVTWRRAEAVVAASRAAVAGALPNERDAHTDPDRVRAQLRELPLVGPWTAESTLVWGLGLDDAYPAGDVALLRAVRLAHGDDSITLKGMDQLAERWRPYRGWATRWLWAGLLGVADG